MAAHRAQEYLAGLVRELCMLPQETEWVEFKSGSSSPYDVGEYISALANSAALNGKMLGYLVWGVEDKTHRIVASPATHAKDSLSFPPSDCRWRSRRALGNRASVSAPRAV